MKVISTLAVLGSLVAGAVVWEGGPDAVIYPPQVIPLVFSHDYHVRTPSETVNEKGETVKLDGEGLKCTFCHEKVASSTVAGARDIPGHSSCEGCHEEWIGSPDGKVEPVEECKRCHTDPNVVTSRGAAAMLVIPEPNLIFSHKLHVDAEISCVTCHANVPKKTLATRDDFPTMDRCIACHESRGVSTECKTCHLSLPSGRLVTELPEGKLEPRRLHSFAIHDADFLRDHSTPARRDKAYCAKCHAEDFCLQCHDGIARDVRYHPGDWLMAHGLKSKIDDDQCQACHRLQSFCLDCHVRSGVATVGLGATVQLAPSSYERRTLMLRPDPRTAIAVGPHPMQADGWLDPTKRNFHGFFAQQNIRSCASCHQEQLCITCHASVKGLASRPAQGGNPHGPNVEALRTSGAARHSARMCLKCHSPYDPSWRR
ncbi:hypothetical protein L6R52_17645 [Myxococcota bacterium]|nr:hypothetical protein [Myxococcota bacterium]